MLRLHALGALSLRDGQGREHHTLVVQGRRMALFCYLALHRMPLRRRDSVLPVFWPEADGRHARASLRQAVHVLRSELGADAILTRGIHEIGVDRRGVWCDVHAFDRAMGSGRFVDALLLHRGPFLDGVYVDNAPLFERWVDETRRRINADVARAAWTLSEEAEAAGNIPAAAFYAHRAMEATPEDESALNRLMRALERLGDRASALRAYQRFAGRMRLYFHMDTLSETDALARALQVRPTCDTPNRPGFTRHARERAALCVDIEVTPGAVARER